MSKVNQKLIAEAVSKLNLLTIKLHTSSLERKEDFFKADYDESMKVQAMRGVRAIRIESSDGESENETLRVFATFGLRMIGHEVTEVGTQELMKIEAVFRADYLVNGEVSEEAISEFTKINAVHNIWPFWREHVVSTLVKAELPEIIVPLFSGNRD